MSNYNYKFQNGCSIRFDGDSVVKQVSGDIDIELFRITGPTYETSNLCGDEEIYYDIDYILISNYNGNFSGIRLIAPAFHMQPRSDNLQRDE